MTWTTEKPTKAGWYWYRDHPKMLVMRYISQEMIDTYEFIGQWSGPIPEPEE